MLAQVLGYPVPVGYRGLGVGSASREPRLWHELLLDIILHLQAIIVAQNNQSGHNVSRTRCIMALREEGSLGPDAAANATSTRI